MMSSLAVILVLRLDIFSLLALSVKGVNGLGHPPHVANVGGMLA